MILGRVGALAQAESEIAVTTLKSVKLNARMSFPNQFAHCSAPKKPVIFLTSERVQLLVPAIIFFGRG